MAARDELDIPLPSMSPSYRAQSRRREDMDPATRRLAAFAGVIGAALLVLVGVWTFTGHRGAGVPVIEPDSRPLRVKPDNPGGLQVAGANESILSGEADGKATIAPPPETPAPQALQAREQAAAASAAGVPDASAPLTAAPLTAAPLTAAPLTAAPLTAAPSAAQPTGPQAATPPLGASPPGAAMAPAAAGQVTVRPESQPPASIRPRIALAPPKPAPAPVAPAPGKSALAAATPAAAAPAGGAQVQIASLHSEEAAMAEWQRLSHKFPDLLANRHPVVSRTDIGGKTWWRLRTSGFADVTQATVFCERMKIHGGGCTVAAF